MPCFSKQTGEKQNSSLFLRAFVSVRLFGCSVFNLSVHSLHGAGRAPPRVCGSDQVILRVRHCYLCSFLVV